MKRALILVLVAGIVAALGLMGLQQVAAQSVTRGISPGSVPAEGGEVEVTINIGGSYGIGSVVEKLPAGFSYVEGSVMPSDITANTTTEAAGQDVSFSLLGESSFTYRVMTSASAGAHSFRSGSKLVYGVDRIEVVTGGDDQVTVAAAQPSGITVTRGISPSSVPAEGGEVTVTITITGAYSIGSVVEKLPAGFSYVGGSVMPSDITAAVDGQDVSFSLLGESSFTYRVMTSATAGAHSFPSGSKLVYGIDQDEVVTGGDDQVTVAAAQPSGITVTRGISPSSVPAEGGEVTVTITITGAYSIGSVVEKLPAGFSYVGGSVMPSDITTAVDGQDVSFSLLGESSFTYRVMTSATAGAHSFPSGSKLVYGIDRDEVVTGGDDQVTVMAATPGPMPTDDPCRETLSNDGAVTGDWADDCESAVGARGYARYYTFTLTEESEVTITLESETDPYMYLREGEAKSGDALHENDDIVLVTNTNSRIEEMLAAGTYTIEATTHGFGETGSFTLTVSGLGDVTTPTPPPSGITVTRSISPSSVPAEGGEVTVTIDIVGAYGVGSVVEKLPAGFSYVDGSVMPADITTGVDGQDVSFPLLGESSFTYRVMTSATAGAHSFPSGSKLVYGIDRDEVVTGGDDQIRVGPAPQTRPPAPRPAPPANNPPTFPSDMVTYTIEENSPPGTNVGEPVTATDLDGDTLTYTLGGADMADFRIDSASGQITVGPDTSLDFETKSMYDHLAVMASDGNGGNDTTSVMVNVIDVDEAPPADPCVNDLGGFAPDRTETLTGTWAADCASENRLGRHANFFSFTLEEATEVTIELASDEDTYLYLLEGMGRDGMALHENDDIVPATDTNSRIQETLVAGTYTIEATTYSVGQMGSFTLTVSGQGDGTTPTPGPMPTDDPCRQTLPGDGAVTGDWADDCESAVGARGYARYYTFTLAEESEVTITLESDTDPYLYLREGEAKSGDFLHENDDIVLVTNTNSMIEETLAAGTYTIEATTYGFGETGSFTLTVSGLGDVTMPMPPQEPIPTDDPCRQTLSGAGASNGMWASACESTTKVGSYARYYTFTLAEESEVTITLESDTDPYLYLREGEAKAGAFLYENDDLAPGDTNSRIQETLAAGTYTIEATTYSVGATGSFTLTVSGW